MKLFFYENVGGSNFFATKELTEMPDMPIKSGVSVLVNSQERTIQRICRPDNGLPVEVANNRFDAYGVVLESV